MVSIPLRSYIREIEKHVENGRNDEAIAHCRHILETYPKYTDVYRLLGKAFLENQRYGDAADIFQRVLSSSPDDFVSNVGMSIVREDEGNLDEAIWHMERAFEIQPANTAIQDELRRLYGHRDGMEPPKIRLTRGALSRMYFKGGLYQQAIAEIRTALADNQNRLDLQILLAEVYSKTGQQAEASELANNVIRKLPYCRIANQIMLDILASTDRFKEMQVFQSRLNEIEPYSAFINADNPSAASVSDHMIKIEKLDWKSGQAISESEGQPNWAKSLGIEIEETAQEKEEIIPQWLIGEIQEGEKEYLETTNEQAIPAFSLESLGEIPPPGEPSQKMDAIPSIAPEEEVPEWMEEVSWSKAAEQQREEPSPEPEVKEIFRQEEGEIASAEIPDWLRTMAPSPEPDQELAKEDKETSWLEEIVPVSETETTSDQTETKEEKIEIEQESELPSWLVFDEKQIEIGTSDETYDQLPDWLKEDLEFPAKTKAPEYTQMGEAKEFEESLFVGDELPEWIFEEHDQVKAPTSEVKVSPSTQELPDWLVEIAEQKAVAQLAEEESQKKEQLIFESEATLPPAPFEELPTWMREEATSKEVSISDENIPPEVIEEISEWEKTPGEVETIEIPEWLLEEEPTPTKESTLDYDLITPAEATEIFGEEQIEETPQVEEETIPLGDTQPRKVVSLEHEVTIPSEGAEIPTETIPTGIPSEEIPSLEDTEAAFAWLESLAVKQGAEEALLLKPEERLETPPEWVQLAAIEQIPSIDKELPGEAIPPFEEEKFEEVSLTHEVEEPTVELVPAAEFPPSEELILKETPSVEVIEIPSPEPQAKPFEKEEEITIEELEAVSVDELFEKEIPSEELISKIEKEIMPEAEITSLEDIERLTIVEPEMKEITEEVSELPDWLLATEAEIHEGVESKPLEPEEKVNINEASLVELERLPGIGFIMAQRIIEYRETNGPFRTVDDLSQVNGVGPVTLDEIRDYLFAEHPAVIPPRLEEETLTVLVEEELPPKIKEARDSQIQGNLESALEIYNDLIQSRDLLPNVIQDLEEIAVNNPQDIRIWQNLGDAYIRDDKVEEALEAYIKAEKLL